PSSPALLPIVAPLVVPVPAVPPVPVAAWFPLPLPVALPIFPVLVPPPWVNTTVSPPAVRLFPAASLACSVSVAVAPDATVLLDEVTGADVGAAVPGATLIAARAGLTALPPMVAPMVVAVPAV